MKIALKILICAVLSMSIGVATASPLLITELKIEPFYKAPEGPKANFEVNTVYANFDVEEYTSEAVSGGEKLSVVEYEVVLNVTNHSEFPARIGSLSIVAAEEITQVPSIVGDHLMVVSGGGKSSGGVSGFVEGLWLDDQWLNVTWLPDGQWPKINVAEEFSNGDFPNVTNVVPPLPEEAFNGSGKWIEGVHVWETQDVLTTDSGTAVNTNDYIFVNGTWVDVTGRVRIENEQPSILATNTLLNRRVNFVSENFGEYANIEEFNAHKESESLGPPDSVKDWIVKGLNDQGPNEVWAGEDGFDNYWQPHESKLIVFKGTVDVGNTNWGLESLAAGKITLYTEACSYLKGREELETSYTNTYAVVTELKQVQVAKTGNNYMYNTVLASNQIFQLDEFGVEAFIVPRS
jgi:hypothetical protein